MANTKPSAAARKAASTASTKTTAIESPAVKREYTFKHKEDTSRRATSFKMISGGGIVAPIRTEVTVFDKELNKVRQIRYCPNEPSIYIEEQSEHARREHVVFRDKMLFVPSEKPNLLEFLLTHPDNKANGGKLFEMIDKSRSAEEELDREFTQFEAVAMVRDKDLSELLPVAMFLGINTNRKSAEIRRDLLMDAKKNPTRFVELFDNPQVKCKSAVLQAIDFQILNKKADGMYWFDTNRLIVTAAAGLDPVDVMSRFCLTEKGAATYDRLLEELDRL
jgi:hypothetical protein